ncbi:response regulator transcription factor [Kribbella sp. NPDC055071]
MKTYHAESARAGLQSASDAGLTWQDFSTAAVELLERAIPYDAICMGITDPATGLVTGRVLLDMNEERDQRFAQLEYGVPDFNQFRDLARQSIAIGNLAEATGGDPARSTRQREILAEQGVAHELRGAVRGGSRMWGAWALFRDQRRSGFSPAESDFMHRVEPLLSAGLRRGLIAASVNRAMRPDNPGAAVIVFDEADQVVSATPSAEHRLAELDGDLWTHVPLAVAGQAVAARAIISGRSAPGFVPATQIRTRSGDWLSLHAAPIRNRDGFTGHVAVTIEAAAPGGVIPLIVAAYGLTERERDVVQLVLEGASTREIAAGLHLSAYTVQDHLKAIFDKVGVTSRRELTSRIFFAQYAGRLGGDVSASGWFEQ